MSSTLPFSLHLSLIPNLSSKAVLRSGMTCGMCLLLTLLLTGCVTSPLTLTPTSNPSAFKIDTTFPAKGQSERIKFIVLHYTAEDEANSLRLLTTAEVSAHYLIPQSHTPKIWQLVKDDKRAWHAGRGGFAGRTALNDTSIGIEIVNLGIKPQYRRNNGQTHLETINNNGYHPYHHYAEYSEQQIHKIAALLQWLTIKYDIEPTHIIGHSDLAPSRKIDPGAQFPWQRLYNEYGVGAWYNESDKQYFMTNIDYSAHTVTDIKQAFRDYGYIMNDTDEWDRRSQNVIYAFQLHFRPHQANGIMDLETYAILRALIKKYGVTTP